MDAFQEIYKGNQVVFKIHQGLFYGFSYCFVSSKMYNARNVIILLEYGEGVIKIAKIDLVLSYLLTGYLLNSFIHSGGGPGVIIYRYHIIPVFNQIHYSM